MPEVFTSPLSCDAETAVVDPPRRKIGRRLASISENELPIDAPRIETADPIPIHPAAAAAAAGEGTATVAPKRPTAPALAVLLSAHILRDGEVVLLILKPSLWFIVFASLTVAAAMAICAMAATLWLPPAIAWYYVEAAIFVTAGRLMWATLQWINRMYILTDLRVLRLSGVFTIDIFDCPLRRIGTTRVLRGNRERLLRLGSIEIQPSDERSPGIWQTIRRPKEVNEMLQQAIARAKNTGSGGLAA